MSDDDNNVEDLEEVALIETEVEMENEIIEETSFNGQDDEITDEPEEEETPTKSASSLIPAIVSPTPSGGPEGSKSLHQLARDGDIEEIDKFLPKYAHKINELDEKKLTPLHYAARYSNIEVMKILFEHGALANKLGDDDMTPLHYAARYGKAVISKERKKSARYEDVEDFPESCATDQVDAVVDYLINQGADINASDKYGMTPLHHTAIRGNQQALEKLLSTPGIIKEPRDFQDSTPLHLASTYNHPNVAITLLKNGDANPRALDNDLRTPLHEACQEGHAVVAKILLENAHNNLGEKFVNSMCEDRDDDGATPLLLGVGKGGTNIVNLLLDFNANPNQRNKESVYPVHSAARTGDLETLKLLCENGASINSLNSMHETPLFLAAENSGKNNIETIKYLLEKGADLNCETVNKVTPIMIAAIEGNVDVVKLLMEPRSDGTYGAKLDICDKDDKSILFHAAEENQHEVMECLLENEDGKDLLGVADVYDNLPIHAAAKKGHLEAVQVLIKHNSLLSPKNEDEQSPIHLAAIHGRVDIVEELIKQESHLIMNEDENSNTPLHLACMNNKSRTAEILLKYGADVHSRNAKKWTPLDCAASVGAVRCGLLLLEEDAPTDPLDRTKTTPLHLAAQNGHSNMIELLLSKGADISIEDKDSRNALELAILSGQKKCVRAILEHKDWKIAMRTNHPIKDNHGTIIPETPLRLLIKTYPDLAEVVFNNCITKESIKDPFDPLALPSKHLLMNYEFIDDAFYLQPPEKEDQAFKLCAMKNGDDCVRFKDSYHSNGAVIMDNHPLMIMAREEQRNLLRHPLCLSLVRRKWKKYGRYIYYSGLVFYFVFLLFLTSFALLSPNASDLLNSEKQICIDPSRNLTMKELESNKKSIWMYISQYGIIIISSLQLILELIQAVRTWPRYIQWTNLFDWIVYSMAIALVVDVDIESTETGIRTCWQWQLLAVNLTLAWLNLLGDVRQLPFLGIYVIMFFDILKTFMQFGLVFVIFIVAFGLGFHLLLINQTPFEAVHYALLKTTVMMTGEFEYEGLIENAQFPQLTYIFFLVFMIIMTIIVVNLLIGLAVDDIQAVQDNAILKRLAMQVELVLDVERLLPTFVLRRLSAQKERIRPKRQQWWHVFTDVINRNSIIKDTAQLKETEKGTTSHLLEVIEVLNENVKNLKSEMKQLAAENQATGKLLRALADQNSIYLDDLDS